MAEGNNQNKASDILSERTITEKLINGVKSNLYMFVVIIISIIYVFTCYVKVDTNPDWKSIIFNSSMGLLVGWIIKTMLGKQGIMKGYESKKVIDVQEDYDKKVLDNNKDSEYYPPFCEVINEDKVRLFQNELLSAVNLKYSKFIHGDYDNVDYWINLRGDHVPFNKKQIEALNKSRHPKIYFINQDYLTNEATISSLKEKKEISTKQYERKRSAKNLLSMGVTTTIFGFFIISLAANCSWANVIMTSLQTVSFISFGCLEYYKSYTWVTQDHVGYIRKRTNYLITFRNMVDNKNPTLMAKIKSMEKEALLVAELQEEQNVEQDATINSPINLVEKGKEIFQEINTCNDSTNEVQEPIVEEKETSNKLELQKEEVF